MQPFSFTLPVHQFDLNLLPPNARDIGSSAFKEAVVAYFATQYAAKGENAIVSVDDEQIVVFTFSKDTNPLDFVMTMLQSGRIKEAVPYLEAMAKTDPPNAQVFYNLGIAYSELGQLDEAIIRLKKTVELEPSHAHAWIGIGVAYQRMRKPEQALEALRKAVEFSPKDGYAHRNLGAVLASMGQLQNAESHFRKAWECLPDDPQAIYGLAHILDTLGDDKHTEEADRLYKDLVQRFPASQVTERAREARTKIAQKTLRSKASGGFRPDAMMYIAGALDTFEEVGPKRRQEIAFEIAMLGQQGLDINDPAQKYTLRTLPGKFSGLQLLTIMYTAFKQIDPALDSGADFATEYEMAKSMRGK